MSRFARPILPKKSVSAIKPDSLPASNSAQMLTPWLNPTQWVRFEYQVVELQLKDGQTHIRGERKLFEDGRLREEKFSAQGGEELFQQTAEQMQQQMVAQVEALLQMMFLPWRVLPGFDRLLDNAGLGK